VLVVVPTSEILLTKVAIPSKNKQRLSQAIPYALENDLTEEIDDLHFTFDPHSDNEKTAVAVISRQLVVTWLERLQALELQPLGLYPEVLCLPLTERHWTIHLDNHQALLRTGENAGLVAEIETLRDFLRMSLEESSTQPEQLDVFLSPNSDHEPGLAVLRETSLNTNISEYRDAPIVLFAKNLDERHPLNLLQGEFQQVDRKAFQWHRWLPAAGLFTLLIIINVVSSLLDYQHYKKQSAMLSAEIQRVFREAVPEAKRIVDPKVQMEQQLKLLRSAQQGGEESFLSLMTYPAEALAKTQASQLESINYKDNKLDLKLTLKDLQSLELIKKSIESHRELNVEIKSANASGNQVTSHLRITRGRL
jgi:general secretion pathway protein L